MNKFMQYGRSRIYNLNLQTSASIPEILSSIVAMIVRFFQWTKTLTEESKNRYAYTKYVILG